MKKKELAAFIYLMTLLLLPTCIAFFRATDITGVFGHIFYLLTALAFFALPFAFLRKRTYFYAMSWTLILGLLETIHVLFWRHSTTLLWVYTLIVAEPGEGSELASVYFPFALVVLTAWILYFILSHRHIHRGYIATPLRRKWLAGIAGGWLTIAFLGFILSWYVPFLGAFKMVKKCSPTNYPYQLAKIASIRRAINKAGNERDTFRFNATTSADSTTLVVLMIGETSRYGNWQLNGYERPSSPLTYTRRQQFCTFDSVFTVANLTTVSVPMMLSPATPLSIRDYYRTTSVVDAFHEAGYRTGWVADQSFNNHFLLNISARCDYLYYHEHEQFLFHDEDMLPAISAFLNSSTGRDLLIVHSLGCHFKYSTRYPKEFAYFRPDLNDVSWQELGSNVDLWGRTVESGEEHSAIASVMRTILTNSYDNAIRYTDFFLDATIAEVEKTDRPVVLIYLGDHGENLLDTREHKILHGQESNSPYEFHIPLFVWTSEAYRQLHPDKLSALAANSHKRASTMNIFSTLLDLGDVELPVNTAPGSLADSTLQADTISYKLDGNLLVHPLPF